MPNKLFIEEQVMELDSLDGLFARNFYMGKSKDLIKLATEKDIKIIVSGELTCQNTGVYFSNTVRSAIKHINLLGESPVKKTLLQSLRLLILAARSHLLDKLSGDELRAVKEELGQFSDEIGFVPRLNPELILPSAEYLPVRYKKTVEEVWSKIRWNNPGRHSSEEHLQAITRHDAHTSSVRESLLGSEVYDYQREKAALCYCCLNFDLVENLHADHLQPAEDIVSRQREMLHAMNIIPSFGEEMYKIGGELGYIICDGEIKQYCGTKKFFIEYYNALDNYWFMHSGENAGAGKGNSPVIDWLKNHKYYGVNFLSSLGKIQQQYILYCDSNGNLLAKQARNWLRAKYSEDIVASGFRDVRIDMSSSALLSSYPRKRKDETKEDTSMRRRKKLDIIVRHGFAAAALGTSSADYSQKNETSILTHKSDSDEEHYEVHSSPNSSDVEFTQENLTMAETVAERVLDKYGIITDVAPSNYLGEVKKDKGSNLGSKKS